MGRYDSHKHPLQYRLNQWSRGMTNSLQEKMPKSMPCHVVEQAQDFIKVAFETANGIMTPPIVKIAQAMSQYAREPTQLMDMGHAVPGSYYLGGVSGFSGGNTNFYPRSNLSTLNFNGISHTKNPGRNYNQLTHMAGPEGWLSAAHVAQQQDQSQQGTGSSGQPSTAATMAAAAFSSRRAKFVVVPELVQRTTNQRAAVMHTHRRIMAKARGVSVQSLLVPSVRDTGGGGGSGGGSSSNGSGGGGQQQQKVGDTTFHSFDKDDLCTIQSKDKDHNVTVDSKNKKATINVPIGEWVYAGGDGKKGSYAKVLTEDGPCKNVKGRVG